MPGQDAAERELDPQRGRLGGWAGIAPRRLDRLHRFDDVADLFPLQTAAEETTDAAPE